MVIQHRLLLAMTVLLAVLQAEFTPAVGALWQIGKADTNTAGFALAPDNYSSYERDGMFVVGLSDPAHDWPYVHPGPDDNWAGSMSHTFQVAFALKAVPSAGSPRESGKTNRPAGPQEILSRGEARLVIGFVDTHAQKSPRLQMQINGRSFEQLLPPGRGNDSIEGRLANPKPFFWEVTFPATLLRAGDNELSITSLSGSWALYDYLALETPPGLELGSVSAALAQRLLPDTAAPTVPVVVTVDSGKVVNTLRGGLGASWHAMETLIPYGVKHPVFTSHSHGGSGWGAYPPAEDERAWKQIYRHASWLGLDWNRVEIEQRVYEPERDKFTFDSPEMRILYRILDWNQQHGAEVFFQQMWCNAAWLAYPEFRDDPVGRVHSAPTDLNTFADGLATLMEHLIKKRGYICIKWLCINNEPNESFSWWQAPPNKPLSIGPGLAAVRKALDQRGLALPLSGPDTTTAFPADVPGDYDYLHLLGAYDFHDYGADFDVRTKGHIAQQERNAAAWAQYAHAQNKPLFLSEFGTMAYGWLPDKPGPSSPPSVLAGSELVIRLANAGVDGFNRWSFLNRGDLDGQWQLVDTWDREHKRLLAEFPPHPNSYFCLGLLSRFTAKHSAVLATRVAEGELGSPRERNDGRTSRNSTPPLSRGEWQRIFCAAFRSPGGDLTLALLNDAPADFELKLVLQGLPRAATFHRYRYGEAEYDRADVRINPQREFSVPRAGASVEWQDTLPRRSLTIYSTYRLEHEMPGVVAE